MKCIILAGGFGGGLWPLSRKKYPKQFIEIRDGRSVFQENIVRNIPFCDEFYIFTNKEYQYIAESQLEVFQDLKYNLFLEEEALNTAVPAILGALFAPSDEYVMVTGCSAVFSGEGYREAVIEAKELAKNSELTALGYKTDDYKTIYGYIKNKGRRVIDFIEKPNERLINEKIKPESWLCNVGIYIFRAENFLDMIKNKFTDIFNAAYEQFCGIRHKSGIISVNKFSLRYKSIEKEILENAKNYSAAVLDNVKWKVVNSFESVAELMENNAVHNIAKNECDNVTIINSSRKQLVVANKIQNAVIVNTDDAVYISGGDNEDKAKCFFMEYDYPEYIEENNIMYRPWGNYEILSVDKGYKVKKVTVYPHKEMTFHKHNKRSEHWSVVEGAAEITIGNETREYSENSSVYVDMGVMHRIANKTDKNTIIIEVEIGSYIDESDISLNENKFMEIIKLEPCFKDYIWGGTRLKEELGKKCSLDIAAESWEMSVHKDGNSAAADGRYAGMPLGEYIEKAGKDILGWKCAGFEKFPIMIKFIDAKQPLSLQVHPDDDYAMKIEGEYGKNEMWYIMDCENESYIYCGFNKDITAEELREHIKNNTLTNILNKINVKKGEAYFIPSGTVHAIGDSVLICEIQQNSNTTYRIYDYERKDKNGNKRELQIEKALDVINLKKYTSFKKKGLAYEDNKQLLCSCKYFEVICIDIDNKTEISIDKSSFGALVIIDGSGFIEYGANKKNVIKGETYFIPAGMGEVILRGRIRALLTKI